MFTWTTVVWMVALYFSLRIAAFAYRVYVAPLLSPLRSIPGPPNAGPYIISALVGQFFVIGREPPGVPLLRWAKQYGSLVYPKQVFGVSRVMVSDPAVLKDILVLRPHLFQKPAALVRTHEDGVGWKCAVSHFGLVCVPLCPAEGFAGVLHWRRFVGV